jgi:hypothetical protein
MKLSQLVDYLQQLDKFDVAIARQSLYQDLVPTLYQIQNSSIQYTDLTVKLAKDYENILSTTAEFENTVNEIKNSIRLQIAYTEPAYFADSFELYKEMRDNDSDEYLLDRTFTLSEELQQFLKGRICLRSDWHYPGLIVRPAKESWIDDMVALDPLYVVDESEGLFEPIKNKFNSVYLNRLRMLVIDKYAETDMLTQLPDQQIAFALIYNFFNYRTLDYITKFLSELYAKIRPGGVVAMTINDCDRTGGVGLVERKFACYTPGSRIKAIAESMGFEIVFSYDINAAATWVELMRPGKLDSLRGGQALAKPVARS